MSATFSRVAALIAGSAVLVAGAGEIARGADGPTVVSRWKTVAVTVDGRADDWTDLTTIPRGPSVAAANDAQSLALVVATSDATLRRTLASGLVVWLDPSGGEKADVGIQLPGSYVLPPGANAASVDADAQPAPPDVIDEVDWLGPGRRRRLLTITPAEGVALASGTEAGRLVYEIELPLQTSSAHPFAVGARPGSTVSIGLFTPDVPKTTRRRERASPGVSSGGYNPYDPYGTGIYGGMGVSSGPPPLLQSEPREEKPPVMKVWVRLRLAAAP